MFVMNSTLVHFTSKAIEDLDHICQEEYALVHIDRDLTWMDSIKDNLLDFPIDVCIIDTCMNVINQLNENPALIQFPFLVQDIIVCLQRIDSIIKSPRYRVQVSTVTTDMCRRFHTDICDLRLLCTYIGKGTLWIGDSNIHANQFKNYDDIDQEFIYQAGEGDILFFKGALYPGNISNPAVHKSPPIQHIQERRLLLRIDTDTFLTIINK
jgi:hypothetical protein